MRIVFVYREGVSLGIGYLSSYIKKYGHETDLVFERNTFSNMYIRIPFMEKIEKALDDTVNNVLIKRPDIIGFSVATAEYQWALEISKKIKSQTNIPIIFGGYHPTLLPQMCINNKEVDMVCLGEGEMPLAELLNSMQCGHIDYTIKNVWFKKDSEIIRNEIRQLCENLDNLPFPDRDLFFQFYPDFMNREIGFVLASRGCPFSCSYCGNAAYNELYRGKGKVLRMRSVDNVIEECLFLKKRYKVKKIHFQDDLFASSTPWLDEFVQKYRKYVGLPFTCLAHPKVMSRNNIELLKKGGCLLAIVGIQSGSERVRKEIFNRYESNEEIVRFSRDCHEVGLNFSFNHIFDAPSDDEAEIIKSAEFYNSVRPKIIDSYCLVYFPKAKIIETAIKEHILTDKDREAIEEGRFEGLHQGGFYNIFGKYYKKYSMLFVLIPLLPQKIVNIILKNRFMLIVMTMIPIKLMPFVKTYLNFRCGSSSFHLMAIRFNLYRIRTVIFDYLQIRKMLKTIKTIS